jgi:hypothetical protein
MRLPPLRLRQLISRGGLSVSILFTACGPRAHIPAPVDAATLPGAVSDSDSVATLARSLAPVLFLHRDEWFSLERVVAVAHPTRPIIAYHLLWRDDAHGSWIPFTVPTDQEIVWVGYDDTHQPTDLWTFWHGKILHTDWRNRGTVLVDAQWGKHGSLPRGVARGSLPALQSLPSFYLTSWLGIWDIALGKATRPGPWCFCRGYARYLEFTRALVLGERVDVVARTDSPSPLLKSVFGKFSNKHTWP